MVVACTHWCFLVVCAAATAWQPRGGAGALRSQPPCRAMRDTSAAFAGSSSTMVGHHVPADPTTQRMVTVHP